MYRLLGFKSVSNARLVLNRRNLLESGSENIHLLFNRDTSLLTLPGKLNGLISVDDDLVTSSTKFSRADIASVWLKHAK
jgi:hypothetical protein